MQRIAGFFLFAIFLFSAVLADGQQTSSESIGENRWQFRVDSSSQQLESGPNAGFPGDCGRFFNAAFRAEQVLENDRRIFSPVKNDSGGEPENESAISQRAALQRDNDILGQRQIQLHQCMMATDEDGGVPGTTTECSSEQLVNFQMSHEGEEERDIPIWHLPGTLAFFFEAGMTIDADGAPNAYHPDNTGLDDLANAGEPGKWEGLAKDRDGNPIVQGPDDPFPGYYVSATALSDHTKAWNDPARYVDASKIPYIVLPGSFGRQIGARPGDFAVVLNLRNGRSSYAIFGDVGPSDRIGEGSVALAENLGIRSDARNGGSRSGVLYLVFPGSGNGRPRTVEEINTESEKLLRDWGGNPQLAACMEKNPARSVIGIRNAN